MADIELVVRLSILVSPIMVAIGAMWPAWRRRVVPYAVFSGGLCAVAANALLRHDWAAHEAWFFVLPSLLLVLPVLMCAQTWWTVRQDVLSTRSMADVAWQSASLLVGVVGIGTIWAALGRGIP